MCFTTYYAYRHNALTNYSFKCLYKNIFAFIKQCKRNAPDNLAKILLFQNYFVGVCMAKKINNITLKCLPFRNFLCMCFVWCNAKIYFLRFFRYFLIFTVFYTFSIRITHSLTSSNDINRKFEARKAF